MGTRVSSRDATQRSAANSASVAASRNRRAELVGAATDIVRESGFAGATVKAITARAGVSAGLLYSYANNAEELLCEVFRDSAGAEFAVIEAAVADVTHEGGSAALRLTTLINTFAARAIRGRSFARALLVEPVSRLIEIERHIYRRNYADLMAEIVVFGVRSGEFAPQDPGVTAAGLIGAISEAMAGPLSPFNDAPDPDHDERVVTSMRELCLRAVGARA